MTDAWLQAVSAAAFLAGLLGGAHCAAMCGGIVGAVCRGASGASMPWRTVFAYNAGRIASYSIAGAIAGALGQMGVWSRGGPAVQHVLLFAASATLIVLALYLLGAAPLVRGLEAAGSVLWRRIQPYSRFFLPADTVPRALGLGLVWGWLPCGMVYAVLLTAAVTGDALRGAAVMAAFGAGTLPNLLAVAFFAQRLRALGQARALRVAGGLAIAAFGLYGILNAVQPLVWPDGVQCPTPADWTHLIGGR